MEFYNIFAEKGLINAIPFFTALYIAYYESVWVLPLFLTLNVIIFYIFSNIWSSKIIHEKKSYSNKQEVEKDVLNKLTKGKTRVINGLFSLFQWGLIILTAIILYPYRTDFVAFLLFWFLVIGFVYNLISHLIINWEQIITAFKSN